MGCSPCLNIVETVCGSHTQGMADGSSSSASFSSLAGVSLDGTNEYYIADAGNHSIREWDGVNVSTVAGNGSSGFADGYGSAARFMVPGKTTRNPSGYLWVADIGNNAIRGIDAGDNVVTCAGAGPSQPGFVNGQGSQAQFNRPTSVFFNAADSMVYIADSHNNVIRRMDSSGNVTTYAGTGIPGLVNGSLSQAQFDKPTDIVIKNGFMYVSDTMNNVIRRIDMVNGVVTTYIS
jgi:serine/threonine-protein kinase